MCPLRAAAKIEANKAFLKMSLWGTRKKRRHMENGGEGYVYEAAPATTGTAMLARITLFLLFFTTLFYIVLVPALFYYVYAYSSFWGAILLAVIFSTPLWARQHWTWFGETAGFVAWRHYFEFRIFKEAPIPITKSNPNVMLVALPHGLFPLILPLLGSVLKEAFPEFDGLTPSTAVANVMFYTPILAPMLVWLGCIPATKEAIVRSLKTNGCLILPDGIAGAFHSKREEECVYFETRKGFIELALKQGSTLVPMYCFGHSQLYDVYPSPKSWLARASRRWKFSLIFFWGEWWMPPLPRRVPLLVVTGKPMQLEKTPDPSKEFVAQVHAAFKERLLTLYYTHRDKVPGYENKKLIILYVSCAAVPRPLHQKWQRRLSRRHFREKADTHEQAP